MSKCASVAHCLANKQKRDVTQQRGRVLLDASPYGGSLLRITVG